MSFQANDLEVSSVHLRRTKLRLHKKSVFMNQGIEKEIPTAWIKAVSVKQADTEIQDWELNFN